MEVTVLAVSDCPNAALLEERLAAVLADLGEVSMVRRTVHDAEEAAAWGMRGSPTLLVDGADPFTDPGVATSLSCRIYRRPDGSAEGAPSVAALRQALASDQR